MNGDCINYNCDEVPEHEAFGSQCTAPRISGMSGMVLILCGNDLTDPSDGVEVQALIDSGDAMLVDIVSIGLDSADATVSTIAATPCRPFQTQFVTYNYSLTDLGYTQQNMDHYTSLIGGVSVAGAILKKCPQDGYADESIWIDGEIVFSGSPVDPKERGDTARFEITFQSTQKPAIIDTPAGIFN